MIINTNPPHQQQQITIDYIRNIAFGLERERVDFGESDSLALSQSDTDSLNLQIIHQKKKNSKIKVKEEGYVSPYRQSSLSMKKIMVSKKKDRIQIIAPRDLLPIFDQKKTTTNKRTKTKSASKYRRIAPMLQRIQKNEGDKMKVQARQFFERTQKMKTQMPTEDKNDKWADFLLRQRKWESEKQDRKMQAQQKLLTKQLQERQPVFTPRNYPKMNIEQHIKVVNRKKSKLKEQLGEHLLNYTTWKSSTPARQRQQSPYGVKIRQVSPVSVKVRRISPFSLKQTATQSDRQIHLRNNKELQFLVNKNK